MPSQFPPLNIPPVPSRDSRFYGSSGSPQLNFWDRFRGKGRPHVGWTESAIAIARSSWLNVLLVIVPVAWALHFVNGISHIVQFIFCFIAIIPLCRLLDYGGENLALYCGKDFGDVIVVSANNAVEATLAICLLSTCQLRLLQATIVGTVLLRLVFVPSMHFISGGARIAAQDLHPHLADLNQTLLTTGVLSLLLPAAFFSALNSVDAGGESPNAVSDSVRGDLLKVSRGLAVLLLAVYLCSRIFLHNPPGSENGLHEHKDAPAEFKERAARMAEEDPEVNPWACLILLFLVVALMAPTAEFLVESIQPMSERHQIPQEFFGLILLPFVSYSAECILSLVYHVQLHLEHYLGTPLYPPKTLAEARSIELSIQFLIFWMPLLVLLAWVTNKPLSLLFDLFEVVLLLSVGFLVNYVTADAKTNWIEGVQLLALYAMMALTAWFYPGQPAVQTMLSCGSIQSFLAAEGVPPNSTFTNISFEGFHATLDDSQINNFTDRLRDLNKLYSLLKQIETGS
ncbi:hypothetical protein DFH07DRAFT_743155 [Mycena maculata]|uniref:Sodium/calcium exchanger membrane region domain-containing protein n=1 Tax=Mycena maculata TaxID=230809 RepID=A0AAD7NDT9_9AGAR|nr:hypothetical protein DFH07DRAFT_743155 [Mycena maculata]